MEFVHKLSTVDMTHTIPHSGGSGKFLTGQEFAGKNLAVVGGPHLMSESVQDQRKSSVGYGKPPVGRPWKKGQSGNPNGRPKGCVNLTDRIRKRLVEKVNGATEEEARQIVDDVVEAYVNAMMKGSIKHVQSFQDRDEGKVPETIHIKPPVDSREGSDLDTLETERQRILESAQLNGTSREPIVNGGP